MSLIKNTGFKRFQLRNSQMKEMYMGRGQRASMPSPGCTLPTSPYVHQSRSSPNTLLRVFTEASLLRHYWLNHWWRLLIQPSARDGTESSNFLITWLVLLATSLRCFPKVIFISLTRYLSPNPNVWEIPRALGSYEPGTVGEDQICMRYTEFGHLNDKRIISYKS